MFVINQSADPPLFDYIIEMTKILTATWLIVPALVISAVGILIWKKRRSYVKVGKISKLFFYPVKSLKAVEVKRGKCTKTGFEVNGVLDRSFMLVNEKGILVSQRDAPTMVLLTPQIQEKALVISTPSGEELRVDIKDKILAGDKIIDCRIFGDVTQAVDCGEEAANFLQSFLKLPCVHLVQYFPSLPVRMCKIDNPFKVQTRKDYPVAFPDLAPYHILSQASIDDLNSKLESEQISVYNFRPNILADNCAAFAEDAWAYVKFPGGAELINIVLTARCLLTTNNHITGVSSKKEPLVTLRKYRIPCDSVMLEKTGSIPCFGINCGLIKPGEISVGEDIYADVGAKPKMTVKPEMKP